MNTLIAVTIVIVALIVIALTVFLPPFQSGKVFPTRMLPPPPCPPPVKGKYRSPESKREYDLVYALASLIFQLTPDDGEFDPMAISSYDIAASELVEYGVMIPISGDCYRLDKGRFFEIERMGSIWYYA